jgi:capsular exopolysaccharide synthesis family protein
MPDTTAYKKPSSLHEVDFADYFRHYCALLWRWKWWIALSTPLAALIGVALILNTLNATTPSLPATVTLGGAQIVGMVRVTDENDNESVSPDTLAQVALIKNRDFLRVIADSLSLRLQVSGFPRSAIFDSIAVDSLAPSARYRLEIDNKHGATYAVFRKDSIRTLHSLFHQELAAAGTMTTLDSLQLPGVRLRFNRSFLHHPCNFRFSISNIRKTVEDLRDSIYVHALPPTMAREFPSFSITVRGNDYKLVATTANMIADKFVERNIRLRQARSQNIRTIVNRQLEKAKSELTESEENLKAYRTAHPTVNLSQTSKDMLSSASLEAERINDSVDESMNSARMLQEKLAGTAKQNLPEVCSEILVFLSAQKNNAAPFLATELSRLTEETRRLESAFDNNHPNVLKNQTEINQIIEKVTSELQNFIEDRKQRQTQQQAQIRALSSKIQALPSEELNLAELSRLQQIKADIYTKLLDKYYQASVSDDSDIPDFYVMDYASPPIPPLPKLDPKVLGLCLFIAVMLIFGPMIAVDLASKTVRTEKELKKILNIDILESIPKITLKRRSRKIIAVNGLSDKLIVNGVRFKHNYVNELFRLLRTKILLRFPGGGPEKTIVITSLESNVGKSLIASNIAIAMAQQNLKTVLIDGDLRVGTIHRFFNISRSPGLSEFLATDPAGKDSFSDVILQATTIPNLSAIPCGNPAANASELIASERLRDLITMLIEKHDVVILDAPPIGIVADALSVIGFFSHYLLAIRAGQTRIVDLKEKIAENSQLRSKLMGVVLNFAAIDRKKSYYQQSKYYFKTQPKVST